MPNRHLGHTSSQQAQPLLSGGRDPPEQPGFSTSQVSSSSTLVDGSLNPGNPGGGLPSQPHGHHHRQHSSLGSAVTASSPMRIPGERTHNRHNLSSSSAQSNATLSNSNPNSHSPSPRTHTRHPSLDRIAAFDAHERQTSVLSSNYALGVVFEQFEHVADKKMNLILNMGVDAEVDFSKILGPDADPTFDKLIQSMASLAQCQQKPVIDAVMRWRRAKIEPLPNTLIKRISESTPSSRTKEIQSILKERQSLASVYILCRALIEIVKSFTAETLPDDLGENLEEIVFNQLKKADPEAIKRSRNRTASMDLFARLIGELSNIRFASVSDRFIAELEKYNSQTIMKERQSHMEMLIQGMRFLKIKIYPLDALEETADFLSSCANFFRNAHGAKVKHAYSKLFVQLLLPIAGVAVAEVNFPAWAKAVDMIYPRALKMTLKPRHILAGYPLVTTLLCVSRKDFFSNNWLPVLESCYQKFSKDKYTRQMALGCVSRLVWIYLFRCTESTAIAFKKLDGIIKTIFPPFRRAIYPTETPLDHFILIAYFTLMRDVDTGMKNVVYFLLNAENPSMHYEYINPERMIIALRAFRLLLSDLERNVTRPPFPSDPDMLATGVPMDRGADISAGPIRAIKPEVTEKVEDILHKTLLSLDQAFGRLLVWDDKLIVQRAAVSAGISSSGGGGLGGTTIFANGVGISGASDSGPQVQHQYATFTVSYSKDKQAHLDVLKAILDCMPRLMPAGIPLPKLVEMLSRYTVHADPEVISAASQALLRIAEQIDSQTVVTGYARFVYRIEDRYCDIMNALAKGPLTGGKAKHGGVLQLYVDLLAIWVKQVDLAPLAELNADMTHTASRESIADLAADVQSDIAQLFSMVEETEANGLLFLCNQSPDVRRPAIQIIKLASSLEKRLRTLIDGVDAANPVTKQLSKHLSKHADYPRVYDFLEEVGQDVIKFDRDSNTILGTKLSIETRIRAQHHHRRGNRHILIHVAESDNPSDVEIWNICYPEVFKRCFHRFPGTIALCRQNICTRLVQIQPSILVSFETAKTGTTGTLSMSKASSSNQKAASLEVIEQWRMYLVFACATATMTADRSPTATWAISGRKGSTVVQKIANARDLFRMMMQYLTCDYRPIREAAIHGLGNVNKDAYKLLVTDLQGYVKVILDEGKHRNNLKPYQNKRSKKHDRLRISLMHVFYLTADCLVEARYLQDMELMQVIMSYVKETKSFLADSEVQLEWEYHKLRVYLCGLVEKIYENIMRLDDPTSIMSFETRLGLYKMFEEWCGYGAYANATRSREAAMMRDVLEQCKDTQERASATQLMEEERKALETAAINAMAMLCRGPLYAFLGQKKARQAVIQFDMLNVLRWIDAVFESPDPIYHSVARRALEAVLIYNRDQPALLDDIIEQCYAGNPKMEFTQGYFHALSDIVTSIEDYPCHVHQIMSLALFKAGDAKKAVRKAAINLLRVIEERVFADSCAKEYEIGITSSLPAIYKHTQALLSARLAVDRPEQTYSMLSEITQRFEHISSNSQREVLTYMLPWLRKVDLNVGPLDTELNATAHMVLSNLYYITIKFGDVYVKETAALWSTMVDHGKNVRAIILYLLDMGLEKRNPWFLIHAKRVFVCLGRTPAFGRVVEEVISEISPRSMVPQLKEESSRHANAFPHLFLADTDKVLPPYAKRPVFARGQLAMVFLVDLAIEAGADLARHLPLLLHCIFVQLDHLTSIVCDQSRCFLINLIHSIVIRQSTDMEASKKAAEVIHWLSSKEGKRLWTYENITAKNRRLQSSEELKELLVKVVDIFSHEDPDLRQKWGETALKWATCCSVRHIACRSFQCFRALMPAFNQHMLADMLARLSNTIADKSDEIRGFALEIIITLTEVAKTIDRAHLDMFPQLFWASTACLYSPYEAEHTEALEFLEVVLDKYGFNNDLAESFPRNWANEFEGLEPLLLKGLQFESSEHKTFTILSSIMLLDNLPLINPSETRLMYLLFGAFPRLLHGMDSEGEPDTSSLELADNVAKLFDWYSLPDVPRILSSYRKQKSKFQRDYLKQFLGAIREVFLDKYGPQALMFALLLLKNKLPFYREKGLMVVENLVPYVKQHAAIDLAALDPLLQLIQTDLADTALNILNTGMPAASGAKLAPSATAVQDLPDEPAVAANPLWGLSASAMSTASQVARHNVHAVVFECSSITNEAPIEHNIQFSIEDFSLLTGEADRRASEERSNVESGRTATANSGAYNDHRSGLQTEDASELMNALRDLDDFFNEDLEGGGEYAQDDSGSSLAGTSPQDNIFDDCHASTSY